LINLIRNGEAWANLNIQEEGLNQHKRGDTDQQT
jgi:hypothetical protein